MIMLPVTLVIAGALALVSIWLGFRVSQLRLRHKVSMGDGGNEAVRTRMRAHANFAEYAPIFLILLLLVELGGGSSSLLWAAGIAFVLARLAHPFGMDRPAPNALRAGGAALTWILLLLLGGYAIALGYSQLQRPEITYAEARASTASPTNGLLRLS